jgi:hypothetical protein
MVIWHLGEILKDYRKSIGNPATEVLFHNGFGIHMDFDKLAQRIIRPPSKNLAWIGMVGIASGVASRRICMNWAWTSRSSSAFCVVQKRT